MHFFGLQNLEHYSLPLWRLKEPGRFIIELRLYSSEKKKVIYTMTWGWINHEVIFIFWWTIPLSNSTFFRICLKKHLKGICESRLWSLLAKRAVSLAQYLHHKSWISVWRSGCGCLQQHGNDLMERKWRGNSGAWRQELGSSAPSNSPSQTSSTKYTACVNAADPKIKWTFYSEQQKQRLKSMAHQNWDEHCSQASNQRCFGTSKTYI